MGHGAVPSPFHFRGRIPASKSSMNRLLVVQSYARAFEIQGETRADDVVKMKSALAELATGRDVNCGAAGTTFRFLALRASRMPGRHRLIGTSRLLARPHTPLIDLLTQLGCKAELSADGLTVVNNSAADSGLCSWMPLPEGLAVDRSISSQFASALLLNCWQLIAPLEIRLVGTAISSGYLDMTMAVVRAAGMEVEATRDRIVIPARAQVRATGAEAELDVSSAFAIVALAVASGGSCEILNWSPKSLQPDLVFVSVLREMGCQVEVTGSRLMVTRAKAQPLRAAEVNLAEAPDLFPVLSVLCAMAKGRSLLYGAPQLAHKESNRIQKVAELLRALGVQVAENVDGLAIHGIEGQGTLAGVRVASPFHPAEDHRMAMAAAVARAGGAAIEILHPETVNKSFPEFWSIAKPESVR